MSKHFSVVVAIGFAAAGFPVLAGAQAPSTGEPEGTVQVTIAEGTNVAVALSPDESTLALDLLGRIWVMPAAGGAATALTDPVGDARQPAWSPDGSRIAFQAYWDGNYHIWSVGADGTSLRQHTRGRFDHREPHWSPDGARLAFSSDRGGSYDIWVTGMDEGDPERLTDWPGDEYGPAFSPDGREVAFAADGDRSGIWLTGSAGLPASTGGSQPRRVTEGDGGQLNAPSWSADGTTLSFNSIGEGRSRLHAVAVSGGEPRTLTGEEEDVFPFRASWTADGDLFHTGDGVVRWCRSDGSGRRDVAFSATVTLDRTDYQRRPRDLRAPGPFPVRGIVSPAVSPDGTRVAFSALGDLWLHTIGGDAERLTDDPWVEADPAWSPDGGRLAFASDRDGSIDLYVRDLGTGSTRRVTEGVAATAPTWSPDGSRIAFVGSADGTAVQVVDLATGVVETLRAGLNGAGRPSWSPDGTSVLVSALSPYSGRFREGVNRALVVPARPLRTADAATLTGADARPAPPAGSRPATANGPSRAAGGASRPAGAPAPARPAPRGHGHTHDLPAWAGWDPAPGPSAPPLAPGDPATAPSASPTTPLQTADRYLDLPLHGSVGSRANDGPAWSPDGRQVAYISDGVLWTVAMTPEGETADVPRRLTNEAADDPGWTGDSRFIVYLSDDRLRRVDALTGAAEDITPTLSWTRAAPPASVLVRAGALFDGRSETLRRNVDIIIENGLVTEVADRDPARTADQVVDASGQVVMPGLIEMHTHGGLADGESMGRLWLSYGVTATRCPACDGYELTEAKEAGESGRRIAPRTFGTGGTIDGSRIYYPNAPALGASAQVELQMGRAAALGHDMIKTYVRLSDPMQRRAIAEAHALGIPVSSHELYPAVAYGGDGVEHVRGTSRRGYSTKVSETNGIYADAVDLLAASGMTLTPTVGIYGGYGLLAAETPDLFDDPRVDAFFPAAAAGARIPPDLELARRMVERMSSLPRRVHEGGGRVIMGTDSPIIPRGLSLHAEMEILVRYGRMRPVDVLRATTSASGEALGYEGLLGVVAPGALADLIVLDEDPLQDIAATRSVRTVILGGAVYTTEELLRRPE
ncbi:MAG: amidohydrolase family protein [Gammaproteobacteria bacterium]|nr:amidohydrolase family protein [Gammaproteobacteria bacterium]